MEFDPYIYLLSIAGILLAGFALIFEFDAFRRRRDLLTHLAQSADMTMRAENHHLNAPSSRLAAILREKIVSLCEPVFIDLKRANDLGSLKWVFGIAGGMFILSAFAIFLFLQSILIAMASAGILVVTGFYIVIQYRLVQYEDAILRSLPDVIDGLIRCLRTGFDLNRALTIIAGETHSVLRHELRILIRNRDLGQSLSDAMFAMAKKMRNSEILYLATLIAVQERSGGPLVEALSSLAKILKDRERLRQKRMVASAEARMSALILGGLPALVALSLFAINPSYRDVLLNTQSGRLFLALAVTLAVIGSFIMYRMIRIGTD